MKSLCCLGLLFMAVPGIRAQSLGPVQGAHDIPPEACFAGVSLTIDPPLGPATWIAEGDQDGARFGYCVASAGDVNGDGFDDVLVGADEYDHGEWNEGRVFVYLGSNAGLATSPAWTAEGNQGGAYFGFSAAPAGDVRDGHEGACPGAAGDGDPRDPRGEPGRSARDP